MPSLLRRLSILLFILLALSCLCSTAPTEPLHPGDQASLEELAKYYSDLRQYITFITRSRYGKRFDNIGVEDSTSF